MRVRTVLGRCFWPLSEEVEVDVIVDVVKVDDADVVDLVSDVCAHVVCNVDVMKASREGL